MIRLPATGIDISQNDLSFHLQQLDIYKGLLKQGFKKAEVLEYFAARAEKEQQVDFASESFSPPASTLELCTRYAQSKQDVTPSAQIAGVPYSINESNTNISPEVPLHNAETGAFLVPPKPRQAQKCNDQAYTPRQSSLLRFVREVSPMVENEEIILHKLPLSPRDNVTYRKRSFNDSCDTSVFDDDDVSEKLEHLSLDEELVPASTESARTTIRVVSNLRPEADSFTPLHLQQDSEIVDPKGKAKAEDDSSSDYESYPSSPPMLPSVAKSTRSPSLPRLPCTPITKGTAKQTSHQQYLDGSFTVYDDAVPARFQPQTPADLSHELLLQGFHAAYTAPPGMMRSPIQLPGGRHPSGDQSPAVRAQLIRERRQREFVRAARVEGLRVRRIQEQGQDDAEIVAMTNFWRDDLDADGVGEENDPSIGMEVAFQRLRTVSGNRRAA